MIQKFNIGVYFFQTTPSIVYKEKLQELYQFVENFPGVKKVWYSDKHALSETSLFINEVREYLINQIIVIGFQIGHLKTYFTKILGNTIVEKKRIKIIDLSDFRNNGSVNPNELKATIGNSIYHLLDSEEPETFRKKVRVSKETLVIGGGIAGIQAALEIANSHNKVYLVEKSGTIGGHMAMFDKTFPTLDCAACILTPKMVEVGQHPFIELMTYSEIKDVTGQPGNYQVVVHQKARRVDIKKCIGCGTCAEKCPSKVPNEFDSGLSMRKAIYMAFPQAVPNKYLIDEEHCTFVQKGKCGVCKKVCPVGDCINLDEQDKEVEITVGNIIVATGFKTFDAGKIKQFGYGIYPNVITSLELERLINAAGPTSGNITLKTQDKKGNWIFNQDNPEPKQLAIIHCVGSRDHNHHAYCSRVCCMYSLKLAHLIKEKLPEAEIMEYYIDMRAYGKGYEEFYNRIKSEDIKIIRGKTAIIKEQNGELILRSEDIENQKIVEQKADMVILSVGLEAREETEYLAEILGITRSEDGWFKELNNIHMDTSTAKPGIWIAGTCQGPKDIPDSVVQASAAASGVIASIMSSTLEQSKSIENLTELLTKAEQVLHIIEE